MNIKKSLVITSCVILLSAAVPANAVPQQPRGTAGDSSDFAAAKALYASASYEDALTALAGVDAAEDRNEVEQYRALCLLALGRTPDAERSLERIVARSPFYAIKDADVSPKLVTMYRDVRKRLLPGAARNLYASAKATFEAKEYADSIAQFKELLAILADPDLADQQAGLADLKQLGDGFLRLAEEKVAALSKGAAGAGPDTGAPAATAAAARIYSSGDRDVRGPVEISRKLPSWTPSNPAEMRTTFRGVLEVIVNEQGAVESATVRQSIAAFYDEPLREIALTWRFRPATLNGEAVKYRKMIEITLQPNGKSS